MDQNVLQVMPAEFRKFKEAVNALAQLLHKRRLFPELHISVNRALSETFMRLDVILQGKENVTFKFRGNFINYLNYRIDIGSKKEKALNFLRERLSRFSIDEIEFIEGITKDELAVFVGLLQLRDAQKDNVGNDEWFKIDHIKIRHSNRDKLFQNDNFTNHIANIESNNPEKAIKREESKVGKLISDVFRQIKKIGSYESREAGGRLLKLVEKEGRNASSILLLNSLRNYDDYTFSHSVNVAIISTAMGRQLGFSDEAVDDIGLAALMHDIGKVYVPREILHKVGKLSPMEWMAVKRHPVDGSRILHEEGMDEVCCRIAYEHHMRYDLKGYPNPVKKRALHNFSHIVRIADSYDALTTNRPYRKQLDPFSALRLMCNECNGEFHPQFYDVFLGVLGNIPVGTMLKLVSGETAVVVDVGKGHNELPKVRLIEDAEGNSIEGEIIVDLNRRRDETGGMMVIKSILDDLSDNIDVGTYLMND